MSQAQIRDMTESQDRIAKWLAGARPEWADRRVISGRTSQGLYVVSAFVGDTDGDAYAEVEHKSYSTALSLLAAILQGDS